MNISGRALAKAYRWWLDRVVAGDPSTPAAVGGLVVLHDELEAPLGTLKIRRGGREISDRGHRGVRSVVESLAGAGLLDNGRGGLTRVGIGIGRPTSRDPDVVSEWVLRQMSEMEKRKIEGAVVGLVPILEGELGRLQAE